MHQPITELQKIGMVVLTNESASALPLERTEVTGMIKGLVATITVKQYFRNPFSEMIELEYLYPLPQDASLSDCSIHIGDRQIHAIVKEVEEARFDFEEGQTQGKLSAILETRRENLYAVRISNIRPGEPITAIITYHEALTLRDREIEFVFPMGITPRYHQPGHPEEAAGVTPPVILPGEKVGPVTLQLLIDLGLKSAVPNSPSHTIDVESDSETTFKVGLSGHNLPDHDFVLRFPLLELDVQYIVRCSQGPGSEICMIDWIPPLQDEFKKPAPREFVFVLDRSGSMTGLPIRQARNALRACLRILEPSDTFRILLFDDQLEWYRREPTQPNQAEIDLADHFLDSIEGRGGTEILQALMATFGLPADPERMRMVAFLTDGAVSAEDRALALARKELGSARVFTFGIGPSVNRALLTNLARIGRGNAEFLQLDEDIEAAILRFQDRVAYPSITDLRLSWENCSAWDGYPSPLPDLYEGQPLQMVTRLRRSGTGQACVQITGKKSSGKFHTTLTLPLPDPDLYELGRIWAQKRVAHLLEQSSGQEAPHQIRQEIISLGIEYHLQTKYTSFVIVDSEVVNTTGNHLSILIAQPLPKGLDWSGFFPQQTNRQFSLPIPTPIVQPKLVADRKSRQMLYSEGSADILHANMNSLPPFPPVQKESLGSGDANPFPSSKSSQHVRDETIRHLIRTQNMDGSWPGEPIYTTLALLLFVRSGHTTRTGTYRKQVQRSFDWLSSHKLEGEAGFFCALAFFELAQSTQAASHLAAQEKLIHDLPTPTNAVERAICYSIGHLNNQPPIPTAITSLNELKLVVVLRLKIKLAPDFPYEDPAGLVNLLIATLG